MKKVFGIAVSMLLVTLIAGCIIGGGRPTSGAFTSEIAFYRNGQKMGEASVNKMLVLGDKARIEVNIPGLPTQISYYTSDKMYEYNAAQKIAVAIPIDRTVGRTENPLKFKDMLAKLSAKKVGEETILGNKTSKYQYAGASGSTIFAWVDESRQIPLKHQLVKGDTTVEMVYTEIKLNIPVKDAEVTLPSNTKLVSQEEFFKILMQGNK
jgi:hypothetical protein